MAGAATFTDGTSFSTGLTIENTGDTHGSVIDFFNNSDSPADNDYVGGLIFKETNSAGGTHSFAKIFGMAIDITDGTEDGALTFETSAGGANTIERMRIDASGNVGIGMVPPSDRNLSVYDATNTIFTMHNSTTGTGAGDGFQLQLVSDDLYLVNYEAGGIVSFYTAPSGGSSVERMRLSSTGKLLIGTTSTLRTNEALHVNGEEGIVARATGNGGGAVVGLESSSNSQGYTFAGVNTSGGIVFGVKVGGAIFSTSTSITSISDERAKENIRDLEVGLEEIIQLKPRRFDWKEGKGSNTKDSIGFIAQEVEQIGGFEVILGEWNDPDIEDAKALKMGDMLPVLVKAIQEQQAIIESQATAITDLTTRLTALETP